MGIEILLYIIIGGFAGMLAGLLGVGGGLIIVPCLVFIYTYLGFNEDVLVHIAIGTSLASIIFTGTSSAYAHYIKDSVDTKILIPITTGIVIGAFIGAVIADHINGSDLRKIIGAFALIIANQTNVFALFMVIIGAFIGTEDLGQYILKALSDKNGAGIGLTLGICVAFIGLIFDNLIRTWVEKRKKYLGIA